MVNVQNCYLLYLTPLLLLLIYGCLDATASNERLQQSMEGNINPELAKYAKETDLVLEQDRRRNRQKIFAVFPELQVWMLSALVTLCFLMRTRMYSIVSVH